MLTITTPAPYRPLDTITVETDAGLVCLYDGQGRCYAEGYGTGPFSFTLSGTLGYQVLVAVDGGGREAERRSFRVRARTAILDGSGTIKRLLTILKRTHTIAGEGKNNILMADGE
ncbi:MAG: hypothetical protein ACOCXJ_06970, partial [Planctomycetota bacterium]